MSDTQWPRYMIYLKSYKEQQFQHAGTVHATDGETALQNGRDTFGRRPKNVQMMAVLDANILSRSSEEIKNIKSVEDTGEGEEQPFYIFARESHQGQCIELGIINANNHFDALNLAIKQYSEKKRYLWWVFPKEKVFISDQQDSDSLFAPFDAHSFKEASDYPVVTMMRKIKSGKGLSDD